MLEYTGEFPSYFLYIKGTTTSFGYHHAVDVTQRSHKVKI